MSKPIFIAKSPSSWGKDKAKEIYLRMADELNDYHVMMFSNDIDKWDFQLFSDKDIPPIKLEKLLDNYKKMLAIGLTSNNEII